MGNKIGRRRQVVDEQYTRPQGLYQHKDVDIKKLRKLILDSKLAPCYPGDEEATFDLEECPICFLYYPSLNRSRCCMKGICTECFLQMKPPHSTRPTQCPFCKTSNYAVEYRGVRSKEEKGMEQLEEQRVIEAQIRIRQQELKEEEQKIQKIQNIGSASGAITPAEVEYQDVETSSMSVPSFRCQAPVNEVDASQSSCSLPASNRTLLSSQNRDENFDLDLEDIMVMEAIWFSIQDHGTQRTPICSSSGASSSEECYSSHGMTPSEASPSGGLACAVAALAERQHMNTSDSISVPDNSIQHFDTLQTNYTAAGNRMLNYQNFSGGNWIEMSPNMVNTTGFPREDGSWTMMDQRSDMAEVGTSYASSDVAVDSMSAASPPLQEVPHFPPGHNQIIPESFEEQMMLAMTVSLVEARTRTSSHGLTWM